MELKEIAAVTGKSGLFRIVKTTRTGAILESLDETKAKVIAGGATKVSILKDISIYTTTADGSIGLDKVLVGLKTLLGDAMPEVSAKSDDKELRDFMRKAVPDYDEEKVYVSDIKKLATWYQALAKYAPEVLVAVAEVTEEAAVEGEEKPKVDKKPAAKKKTATNVAVKQKGGPNTNAAKTTKTIQRKSGGS